MNAGGRECVLTFGLSSAPRLSVLTPFYRHDPRPLLRALARTHRAADVEIILLDDGGANAGDIAALYAVAEHMPCAVTLIVRARNQGRAAARNRLLAAAQARHVLFLDADMIPESPDFLDRWLDLIEARDPAIAFGGFSVPAQAPQETALHRALSHASDCRDADARNADPAQFTTTSNLLVRRDVLVVEPFDDAFHGWGWEDVEWALRAAACADILHIDNRATHVGLDSAETLLRKARQAGPNYARLAAKHPHAVRRFRTHRAARLMKRSGAGRLKPLFAWAARDPLGLTPMRARCAALKLYRATIYGESLP